MIDGGPAFPHVNQNMYGGMIPGTAPGMSLRDFFAATWRPTERDVEYATRHGSGAYYNILAGMAYAHADALIEARSEK